MDLELEILDVWEKDGVSCERVRNRCGAYMPDQLRCFSTDSDMPGQLHLSCKCVDNVKDIASQMLPVQCRPNYEKWVSGPHSLPPVNAVPLLTSHMKECGMAVNIILPVVKLSVHTVQSSPYARR